MKLLPRKNIGTPDRVVRLLLGLVIMMYVIMTDRSYGVDILLTVVALFCFYQALTNWCLWYQIIGKNTCPMGDPDIT